MQAELVVKGIILDKDKRKVLLLRRSASEDIGVNTWENAGGKVEMGETLEEALRREIKEEAGLSVKVGKLAYASYVSGEKPLIILVYYCTVEGGEVRLSSEHCEARWADREACKALLGGGIAKDFEENGVYDMLG